LSANFFLCFRRRCETVLCVPFTDIDTVSPLIAGSGVKLGAQNCHWEEAGAYTGEISAKMLVETGVSYVILGHSERRQYFAETMRRSISASGRP
jgi:triosephosphate isomerase